MSINETHKGLILFSVSIRNLLNLYIAPDLREITSKIHNRSIWNCFITIFVAESVPYFLTGKSRIKREPGVNPGQSRCCEAPFNLLKTSFATDNSREGFNMGSKSEDLPFIKGSYSRGLGYESEKIHLYFTR